MLYLTVINLNFSPIRRFRYAFGFPVLSRGRENDTKKADCKTDMAAMQSAFVFKTMLSALLRQKSMFMFQLRAVDQRQREPYQPRWSRTS